jgi:spore germination cell wall hydrolase CwlJ-like protein
VTLRRLDSESWGAPRVSILWVGLAAVAAGILVLGAVVAVWMGAFNAAPLKAIAPHTATAASSQPPAAPDLAALDAPQVFEQVTPQQAALLNAQVPVSTLPNPPAAPFNLTDASAVDRANALNCLTLAVYYEAATQAPDGQAAVAQVVLNRVRNVHFPKSVCGVVFQGSALPTGCQFTFTCDGSLLRPPSVALWRNAQYVAQRALNGYVQKQVGLATHYHTIWVVPYWQSSVLKVGQIGAHVFYRMGGSLGLPVSFATTYGGGEFLPTSQALSLNADLTALLTKPPVTVVVLAPVQKVADTPPPAPVIVVAQSVAVAAQPIDVPAGSVDDQHLEAHVSAFGHAPTRAPTRLPIPSR